MCDIKLSPSYSMNVNEVNKKKYKKVESVDSNRLGYLQPCY